MRLDSGIIENYHKTGGKIWLSANHNKHVKDNMTYTGADSLEEKKFPYFIIKLQLHAYYSVLHFYSGC